MKLRKRAMNFPYNTLRREIHEFKKRKSVEIEVWKTHNAFIRVHARLWI